MLLGIIVTWIPQFVLGVSQFIVKSHGGTVVFEYASWYAAYLFMAIFAIWAYPCYKFFRLYQSVEDAKVKRATLFSFSPYLP